MATQTIIIADEWRHALGGAGLNSVEAVYAARGEVVTRSGTTEVMRTVVNGNSGERVLFIKKYWVRGFHDLRRTFLRGAFLGRSKVKREFENLRFLRAAGVDAPDPVAYGEERRLRALVRSFLITEGVRQPKTLTEFIRDHLPGLDERARRATRRTLVDNLADYTRLLHARRFVHHDYFWRNILLSGTSLDRFWLIDTPKGRRWRWRQWRNRAKDLGTLDAAAPFFFRRAERLRFFLRYAGALTLTPGHKRIIRRALAVAEPLRESQWRRVGPGKVHGPTVD